MTLRHFTIEDQIEEIEKLIVAFRKTSPRSDLRSVAVLKFIAAELRGRLPGASSVALRELEGRINDAMAARTRQPGEGFPPGAMIGLGQELVGRWLTVKRALEQMAEAAPGSAEANAYEAGKC